MKKNKKKKRIMQVEEDEFLKEATEPLQLIDNTLQILENSSPVEESKKIQKTNVAKPQI